MSLPPLLVIVGPTAAGKTAYAIDKAQALGTEILSADSVQVYRHLDIGSAKPSLEERQGIPHHLIDIRDPDVAINAGAWVEAAEPILARLHAEGKTPIICGGTGLYIRALLQGLAEIPQIPEPLQAELRARAREEGPGPLHAELMRHDPEAAQRLDPTDTQRITRALGVVLGSGRTLGSYHREHQQHWKPRYHATMVGIFPDRALLYDRINRRAEAMVHAGLIQEVADILAMGYPPDSPGLLTMGYREVVSLLQADRATPEALIPRLSQAHRRYAKRQITWWRHTTFDEIYD